MIIYTDIISGDEIISDVYKLKEVPGGMFWEVDCKKYVKGNENIELAGANPSAEGGDDGGGDGSTGKMVHDIEEAFQMQWLDVDESGASTKPSKDDFKAHLKAYIKKVNNKLKEKEGNEEVMKEFQAGAPAAMKKLLANYDNYDVLIGSSMNPDGMHVLIDFREDGMTPFATVWKHGLVGHKV